MHGLVNRAIQCFVVDTYGADIWTEVKRLAGLDGCGFDAMLSHDAGTMGSVLGALYAVLNRTAPDVLEDIGTYLVSHPDIDALRRLLRFGGEDFIDFLYSLDDLHDRARLAVPDLDLPMLELIDHAGDRFSLQCLTGPPYRTDAMFEGFGHVMMGVLRVMADDYGALIVLDHCASKNGCEVITISLIDQGYSAGRQFQLSKMAG